MILNHSGDNSAVQLHRYSACAQSLYVVLSSLQKLDHCKNVADIEKFFIEQMAPWSTT